MSYYKNDGKPVQKQQQPQPAVEGEGTESTEGHVKVDGFAQVLAMLQIADPEFRESILRRLAARDLDLARSLRAEMMKLDL